jgi:tubulin polyglutamylase TTLL1
MRQYYDLSGQDHSLYLPKTFHITGGIEDDEYLNFLTTYHERKKNGQPNYWIIKPGELSNRGNGINVCDSLDSIKLILKNKERHENGKFKTYILQQYLDSPFLYKGRKFDIRHYILITRINGVLKGYWYEEGYIRTTSYEYHLGQMNSQIHLTNDAVQKHCRDYGKFEKGNKLSYR